MWGINIGDVLSFIGATTLITTLVSLVFTQIIKGSITTKFSEKLETHKNELVMQIESMKHEQNKMYKDFELFTVKKHEYYPELYKLVELSIGEIIRLRGYKRALSFDNVNKHDIESFMNDKDFTSEDKETILNAWDNHRDVAINHLNYRLIRINYNLVYETFTKANDFHLLNALYFSEDVFGTASKLIQDLHHLLINYDPDYPVFDVDHTRALEKENEILVANINKLRVELKAKLRSELSKNH